MKKTNLTSKGTGCGFRKRERCARLIYEEEFQQVPKQHSDILQAVQRSDIAVGGVVGGKAKDSLKEGWAFQWDLSCTVFSSRTRTA